MTAARPATLLPHHDHLIRVVSAIAPAVADARGYCSLTVKADAKRLGFGEAQARVPALLIPIWNVHGETGSYQLRPDTPRITKRKAVKYETPHGSHMLLDVPPGSRSALGDPTIPLLITEAPRKADAAVSVGFCAIAIIGVWNWRGKNTHGGLTVLADWECIALNGRTILLAFDSDVLTKREVHHALTRFKAFLESRQAHVRIVRLPHGPGGSKMGLDDFLAAGHDRDDVLALVSADLPPAPPTAAADVEDLGPTGAAEHLSDLGNAQRLWRLHGADVRWIKAWDAYYLFDGRLWREDNTEQLRRWAEDVVRDLHRAAVVAPTQAARESLAAWALRSESVGRLYAMVELLKGQPGVAIEPNQFDADPWILSCPNGVLELRTFALRPHRREDFLTKITAAPYDPAARSDVWERFLREDVADADTITTLQRFAGYSLTGDVQHDKFLFIYGPGGSGKSTLLEALKRTLGDYAGTAQFETFMERRRDRGAADDDRADLRGRRLVAAVETTGSRRWATGIIKLLTGGAEIRARHQFERLFSFPPQFKLWLAANERPDVDADNDGFWRRILEVPFPHGRPEDKERDPRVRTALIDPATSGAAILAWAVQGCRAWHDEGCSLGVSTTVKDSTRAYRERMDSVAQFLADRCELFPIATARPAALRAAYVWWCKDHDVRPVGGEAWPRALAGHGIELVRKSPTAPRIWLGVTLLPDADAQEEVPF